MNAIPPLFGSDDVSPPPRGRMARSSQPMPARRVAFRLGSRNLRRGAPVWCFGRLLVEYRFTPGDLFDTPQDGKQCDLAWFLKGSPLAALYPRTAQTHDGRIWRRPCQ